MNQQKAMFSYVQVKTMLTNFLEKNERHLQLSKFINEILSLFGA
jgi:hypothetical protein